MVLSVNNLEFNYETKKLFSNLCFDLKRSETLTILGINGIGKSTLIKCILGLLEVENQTIKYGEKFLENIDIKSRSKFVSYVSQQETNPFSFSVYDTVMMGRNPHISFFSKPNKEDEKEVLKVLDIVGVTDLKNRSYNELSGGEMQLVMIARALASNPKLLIMDEPISHLDVGKQNEILKLIKSLNEDHNISVLMTSHYPDHALAVSHKVLLLQGELKNQFGDVKDILNSEKLHELFGVDFISLDLENKKRIIPKWEI